MNGDAQLLLDGLYALLGVAIGVVTLLGCAIAAAAALDRTGT